MSEKKLPPVIIDTDPGIDDASALFWVLTSKKFDIKALTIVNALLFVFINLLADLLCAWADPRIRLK